MSDPALDLAILEALVEALPKLLDSGALTRVVVLRHEGQVHRPAMTVGQLLMRLHELEQHDEASDQNAARLLAARAGLRKAREDQADAYAHHLRRELKSQIGAWRWFIEACEDGSRSCAEDFAVQTMLRARMALMLREAAPTPDAMDDLVARLAELDARFDALTTEAVPGPELSTAAFPASVFPWLYRRPR